MRTPASLFLLLAAVFVAACSDAGPVGFYNAARIGNESTYARSLLGDVVHRREVATKAAQRADDAAAKADEINTAKLKEEAVRAHQTLDGVEKEFSDIAGRLDRRAESVLGKIATKHRMTIVLSVNGRPPYAAPGADLTGEIIAALDGDSRLSDAREAQRAAADRVRALEEAARGRIDGGR